LRPAALGDPEGAEAGDADLLASLQRLGDGADQRLHGLAGIGQAGVRRDGRDQIHLVHECRPNVIKLEDVKVFIEQYGD
jgi:hypothetical protein